MILSLLLLASIAAAPSAPSPDDRAWSLLKAGVSDQSVDTRIKAVHALGLAGPRTQFLAEKALTDADKQVRSKRPRPWIKCMQSARCQNFASA
jgi:hypothetical protein